MKKLLIIGIILSGILCCQNLEAQSRREKRKARKSEKEALQRARESQNQEVVTPIRPEQVTRPSTETSPQVVPTNSTLEDRNPQTTARPVTSAAGRNPASVTQINLTDIIENSRPVITQTQNGTLNWSEQFIEAVGSSVIDTVRFNNISQAKAMATRGAVVVAQRNLLETIQGVRVTSETTVREMVTMNDFIYTRVDGVVKGAEMVGEAVEKNGMMEVRMRVQMYKRNGLAGALYEHIPEQRSIHISQETQDQLSTEVQNQLLHALALNLNGQQLDPALFPVIVDENNNLVLDFSKLYNPNTGTFPQILNSAEQLFTDLGIREGVEVIDVLRTEPGKIVLDNENMKKINWSKIINTATSIGKFLMLFI
ncbi:MAG: hypothetical protein PHT69_04665 [Bacteroidales bacterium]|nr:hypothetical protein [Bacteroidales bacterium]